MVNAKNQLEDIKASITAEQAFRKESVGIYACFPSHPLDNETGGAFTCP